MKIENGLLLVYSLVDSSNLIEFYKIEEIQGCALNEDAIHLVLKGGNQTYVSSDPSVCRNIFSQLQKYMSE